MVEIGLATRERQVRLATGPLLAGALGTVLGIVLSVLIGGDFAAALTLAGALMLLWGVHRLGRLGADPPEGTERGLRRG
jgi:hypothetical protein